MPSRFPSRQRSEAIEGDCPGHRAGGGRLKGSYVVHGRTRGLGHKRSSMSDCFAAPIDSGFAVADADMTPAPSE
jgi:hypothetical protein